MPLVKLGQIGNVNEVYITMIDLGSSRIDSGGEEDLSCL